MITVICQKHRCSNTSREKNSIKQLIAWGQEVHPLTCDQLNSELLIQVLRLSQLGFDEIVVQNPQSKEIQALKETCYSLFFNQAIPFILSHPELLKTPIILDEKRLLVGYNSDAIRVFTPRPKRITSIVANSI